MHGQLTGLVNKPRHKDEDDKESEEALVAAKGGFFEGPAQQSVRQRQTSAVLGARLCLANVLPFWGVRALTLIIPSPLPFPEFPLSIIKPQI